MLVIDPEAKQMNDLKMIISLSCNHTGSVSTIFLDTVIKKTLF